MWYNLGRTSVRETYTLDEHRESVGQGQTDEPRFKTIAGSGHLKPRRA